MVMESLLGLMEESIKEIKKDDKKDGYGIFEWADGKKYRGYWSNGKQNGEGEFYNEQTKTWRKCLVQNGRRVKWLDE